MSVDFYLGAAVGVLSCKVALMIVNRIVRDADTKRLDWLESANTGEIEPGGAFPDGFWRIWEDGSGAHLGRGPTLRSAVDAAMTRPSLAQGRRPPPAAGKP